MIQQAVFALKNTYLYDPAKDSLRIAALALAAPSSTWPLDTYHRSVINVEGDLIASFSGVTPLPSPLSTLASADIAAAVDLQAQNGDGQWLLTAQAYWGLWRLHQADKAYFGQPTIYAAIHDSLARLTSEVSVARVVITPASMFLEIGQTARLDSSVVAVYNKFGRKLVGRKVALFVSDPSRLSADSMGVIRGVAAGAVTVIAQSHGFADTVAVTVGDRPVDWGPPVTAHDSLTTGTWTGTWRGYKKWSYETADQGSGTYQLQLEAHNDQVRGTVTWTSTTGSYTARISRGKNRRFIGVKPQLDSYTADFYFAAADFPVPCGGNAEHNLALVFDWVYGPSAPRSAGGTSYLSCNGTYVSPTHSRMLENMGKVSGPLSSLMAPYGLP